MKASKLTLCFLIIFLISTGLFFILRSLGNILYTIFIPFIWLVYFPVSWAMWVDLEIDQIPSVTPHFILFFFSPGYFILKTIKDLKSQKGDH